MLAVGTRAPAFTARLDDGSEFSLAALRGEKNVVLYFYPKDFSGGCTRQACSFRDNYASIGRYDAVLVGVSADSEESHRSFKQQHELSFPLLADTDGKLAELYDVKTPVPLLRPRITYVIDKQGVIRAAIRHDILIGKHLGDTIDALEAIESGAARA